jgi:VanZ family protein
LKNSQHLHRIILWVTVMLYTASLPYVILVFQAITRHFSAKTAGNVPLFIILLLAVVYIIACIKVKKVARGIIILAISAVIVSIIMTVEANPNKYIHIPEYVLMAWLLYQALAIDYKGRGILLLVFLCAAMLGVVDELLQGIHPQRTYGWKDMINNAASSLIGILTLMGAKCRIEGDWAWIDHLKDYKAVLGAIFFGGLTAVLTGIYLLEVQVRGSFHKVYPSWLLAGNGLFLASAAAAIFFFWRHRQESGKLRPELESGTRNNRTTALLWVMSPLAILISINLLVVWVAVAGFEFR